MTGATWFPTQLDNPARIMGFKITHFMALLGPLLLGFMLHGKGIGLVMSLGCYWLCRALDARWGDGYWQRLCYWYLPLHVPPFPPADRHVLVG